MDTFQDMSESNIAFIPVALDEMELTPVEFRVYCHLSRRSNKAAHGAWPSIPNIAKHCKIGVDGVRYALQVLEAFNMVSRESRIGASDLIILLPPSKWVKSERPENRKNESKRAWDDRNLDPCSEDYPCSSEHHPLVPRTTTPLFRGNKRRVSIKGNKESTEASQQAGDGERDFLENNPVQQESGQTLKVPPSCRGIAFAEWFHREYTPKTDVGRNWKNSWADLFDKLVRLDKRTEKEISEVCKFAKSDPFWSQQFHTPLKLRDRNGQGIKYYDVFLSKMKPTNGQRQLKPGWTKEQSRPGVFFFKYNGITQFGEDSPDNHGQQYV